MRALYFVLALTTFRNVNSAKHDGAPQVFTRFFARRHVQTITAHTCWSVGKSDYWIVSGQSLRILSVTIRSARAIYTRRLHFCFLFSTLDADKKLLESLSTEGISASFRLPSWSVREPAAQPQVMWYRHAFFIDLSCDDVTTSMFRQVI